MSQQLTVKSYKTFDLLRMKQAVIEYRDTRSRLMHLPGNVYYSDEDCSQMLAVLDSELAMRAIEHATNQSN